MKNNFLLRFIFLGIFLGTPSLLLAKKKSSQKKNPQVEVSEKKSSSVFIIDPNLSTVTLRLSHSILGRFDTIGRNALRGNVELDSDGKTLRASSIEFMVDHLSSLIGLRDRHMKEDFLDSKKFPLIFMKDSVAKLLDGPTTSAPAQTFEGRLWVKQIESNVRGESRLRIEDELLVGSIEFDGKLSTFSIKPPTYMGVGVKDELKVLVELTCRPDLSDLENPDLNSSDF